MTRRILAIDGGGVRGVIPAVALAALERSLGGRVRDHVDFVAGTSTGALIAAAVAAGVPGERIVRMYVERAPELFRKVPVISTIRRILLGHMYDARRLHRLIREELDSEGAGDWTLNDVPLDIMVTAKGLLDSHQWYFVKDRPGRPGLTGDLSLVDCLTASAAAPTYFAPWPVEGLRDRGPMVDGGTGVAGNPVYQACVVAFHYTDGYEPANTIVISMGTGQLLKRPPPTWIYSWLHWVLAELLRSPGEQQTELVDRHYHESTFYRLDVKLDRDYSLDNAGEMATLRDIGERFVEGLDWPAILAGRPTDQLVTPATRQATGYAQAV